MSSLCITLGAGEMLAVCDFTNGIEVRDTPMLFSNARCCMLCGNVSESSAACLIEHAASNKHRQRMATYLSCSQSIRAVEQSMLNESDEGLSRRETALRYLSLKLARSDVMNGLEEYNQAAVRFLLQKNSVSELLRAFMQIEALEHSVTRGLCTVCLDRPSRMMFTTCRHVCTCSLCAAKLQVAAEDSDDEDNACNKAQCPICRQVSTMVAVFLQ